MTCGVVAGDIKEISQQVTGTAAEKAEQGKEKLAQAAGKGKEKASEGTGRMHLGIRAPTTPEHKVQPLRQDPCLKRTQ